MSRKRPATPQTDRGLDEVESLFAQGSHALQAGDPHAAAKCFQQVIQLFPDLAEAHGNLGVAREAQGDRSGAERAYRQALRLDPEHLQMQLNLGALLVLQKRFEEAATLYGTLIHQHPEAPSAWCNLGVLHTCRQEEELAERCFRTALDLDATYAKARFNLSYLLLRQGRMLEGWPALEARPWSLDLDAKIPAPRWRGEPLAGQSLLIGCEGGYGDWLQFVRYVPILKAMGAGRIGIVCQPTLTRLFTGMPELDAVVAVGDVVPPGWDLWTLPLSLPHLCQSRVESLPASIPYLHATTEDIAAWRARLPDARLRIGLAWKGNPAFENDADRSLSSLTALAPLALVEGIQWVSLQMDRGQEELAQVPAGMRIFDPSPWIRDFADTAALMSHLDLVLSVDTAAAHLAGALGRPCWVLLPHYKTDWRWFRGREDSPWYPRSMRLFRQAQASDWRPVIEAVALALQSFEPQRQL